MEKTVTQVFCIRTVLNGNESQYEVAENGTIPALEIVYPNGDKYLFLIVRATELSFENKAIRFEVRQLKWDVNFNLWLKFDSNKLVNSELAILEGFLVRATDGKWQEELTEEELEGATLVGEFQFWFDNLAKTVIIPGLMTALENKLA